MSDPQKPRAHPRGKVTGVDLFCYRAALSPTPRIRKNIGVEVLDISQGGARVEVTETVKEGESITVELRDSATGESFRAQGEVRWSVARKAPGGTAHHLGVQFRDIYTPMDRRDRFTGGKPSAAAHSRPGSVAGGSEKRVTDRFQLDDYVVTCIRQRGLSPGGLKRNVAKQVLDMSLTGVQILAREKLDPAERVVLTLHLNQFAELLEIPAEVRWSRPDPGVVGENFRAGLQFQAMTEDKRKKVEYLKGWFTTRRKK